MNVIEMKEVVKQYKDTVALDHFNLTVKKGELVGLLGPNGCGKTTAIHSILGLLNYDYGIIRVFEHSIDSNNFEIKRRIGIVPQEVAYFENLTVYENIDFFAGLYISDKMMRKQYVEEAIDFVKLEDYRKFFPKKLSGGLKRRLNIACGIVHQPSLIFMDEPTVAVDAQSRQFILDGVKKLNEAGVTIVYTTHYLDEANYLCDRIIIMDKGRNIISGTSTELKNMISVKEKIFLELVEEVSDQLAIELKKLPNIQTIDIQQNNVVFEFNQIGNNIVNIALLIQRHQLAYLKLFSEQPTLNDVFLSFTGKDLRD